VEHIDYLADSELWDPPLYITKKPNLSNIHFNNEMSKYEPLKEDIESGKNTYVYDAHTYHTKVPPAGIEEIIKHYSKKNDVILDPFCGSGMTGVAATNVDRQVVLSDISPSACFISYNYLTPINPNTYMNKIYEIVNKLSNLNAYLYNTKCVHCGELVPMLYQVWSYGLICPHCNKEFVLWDIARDEKDNVKESKILLEFNCPHCNKHLSKRNLKRTKLYPVQIGYKCCSHGQKESAKIPDDYDIENLKNLENYQINTWYPKNEFPLGFNTKQAISAGINTIDKLYTKRALIAYSALWDEANKIENEALKSKIFYTLTSLYQRITVLSEFRFWGGSGNIANYNVPSIMNEQNVFSVFIRKAKTIYPYLIERSLIKKPVFNISVSSATNLSHISSSSIDFVFTDPPFGSNINYSEMNLIWESWLGKFTDTNEEAIINKYQNKGDSEYENLLTLSFKEIYRVLKPNAWACIVFHNSSDKVWKSLKNAIDNSGLHIVNIQLFNKKHGTFKQFVSNNSVGYDLVLHCNKSMINDNNEKTLSIKEYFIIIRPNISNYKVQYLHVNRKDEIDYRKMYSEYLSKNNINNKIITSFENFTKEIQTYVKEMNNE